MNILRHNPSALSSAVAPIARVWLGVQDSVARVVGFKNSGNLAGAVTGAGVAVLLAGSLLLPAVPLVATAGATLTTVGVVGLVENKVTTTLAKSDRI